MEQKLDLTRENLKQNKLTEMTVSINLEESSFVDGVKLSVPCTQAAVDLSYLLKDFHISNQNAQCSFHANTPSQMQHP